MKRTPRPLSVGAALLVALAALAGCDDGIERNESNDILTEPEYNEVADGVYMAELRYNPKRVGQSESKPLRVRHGGLTPLRIRDLYLEMQETPGANEPWTRMDQCSRITQGLAPGQPFPPPADGECWFAIDQGPELPLVLEDDAFEDYSIVYSPPEVSEPKPWRVVIETNVIEKPVLYVTLGVVATAPRIDVNPRTVAFESPSQMASAPVQVFNRGTGLLVVSRFELLLQTPPYIDPATQQPVAEIKVEPRGEWSEIQANRSQEYLITYDPQDQEADHATLRIISNDPNTPSFDVTITSEPVSSNLVVQPNPVQFPEVGAGSQGQKSISLTNSGLKDLDIIDMRIEQASEEYSLGDQQRSFQLRGGASREVTITYQPRSAEGSNAELVIQTQNADNVPSNELRVQLVSSGTQVAALQLDRLQIDFSAVGFGDMATEQITLTNPGTAPLDITRLEMSTDADVANGILPSDPEFTLSAGGGATTIAPGASHTVMVTFARGAEDRARHIGAVVIESNANSSPDSVNLVANPPAE